LLYSHFGVDSIEAFMADREFIGEQWFDDLLSLKISFYIRLRNNMLVRRDGQEPQKVFWLFNNLKQGSYRHYEKLYYLGRYLVYLSGCKIFNSPTGKVDYVVIASYNNVSSI